MRGYIGQSEKTADVIRDGWYVTGDIATIDEDRFVTITGRVSRFSKIGGEMVPHIRVEEALLEIIGQQEDDAQCRGFTRNEAIRAVVTAVPDKRTGERLVVVHTELGQPTDAICQALAAAGLPNLWIPSPDSYIAVDAIPVLGTGKLDLKGVAGIAREQFGQT